MDGDRESVGGVVPNLLRHTCQFIGHKIRKIRWQKVTNSLSGAAPEKFATASWDETVPENNEVTLWHVAADYDAGDFAADQREPGQNSLEKTGNFSSALSPSSDATSEIGWKFVRSATLKTRGDVSDLRFLNENHLIFATTNGELIVAQWFGTQRQLRPVRNFPNLHSSCVAFSIMGDIVASIGSDGTLKVVNLNSDKADEDSVFDFSVANENDSSSVGCFTCIDHFGAQEIITGNAVGQLQLWDLRQPPRSAVRKIISCNTQQRTFAADAVTALRSHPSQHHVIAAGYQSGSLAFWDLRNARTPASIIAVHNGPIWEVVFHPIAPHHLYTASNDGSVLHWDATTVKLPGDSLTTIPWLYEDTILRDRVKLTSLIPSGLLSVNSIDVAGDSLLAGVDNESLWMVKNLPTC